MLADSLLLTDFVRKVNIILFSPGNLCVVFRTLKILLFDVVLQKYISETNSDESIGNKI